MYLFRRCLPADVCGVFYLECNHSDAEKCSEEQGEQLHAPHATITAIANASLDKTLMNMSLELATVPI